MTCRWWNRWYHRRLRAIDRETMLSEFWDQAERMYPDRSMEDLRETVAIAWLSWEEEQRKRRYRESVKSAKRRRRSTA